MKKNIVLIGMPASGKSTAGVLLAKKTGYEYTDTDLLLQRAEKALLYEILERKGVQGFIEAEERVNMQLNAEHCVIATGGSAVYSESAMKKFAEKGVIVYLHVSIEELSRRLAGKDIFRRGVVMRKKGETLSELYEERVPLYEKYAEVIVDCDGLNLEQTVEAIMKGVGEKS